MKNYELETKELITTYYEKAKDSIMIHAKWLEENRCCPQKKICLFGAGPNGVDQYMIVGVIQRESNQDLSASQELTMTGCYITDK